MGLNPFEWVVAASAVTLVACDSLYGRTVGRTQKFVYWLGWLALTAVLVGFAGWLWTG